MKDNNVPTNLFSQELLRKYVTQIFLSEKKSYPNILFKGSLKVQTHYSIFEKFCYENIKVDTETLTPLTTNYIYSSYKIWLEQYYPNNLFPNMKLIEFFLKSLYDSHKLKKGGWALKLRDLFLDYAPNNFDNLSEISENIHSVENSPKLKKNTSRLKFIENYEENYDTNEN